MGALSGVVGVVGQTAQPYDIPNAWNYVFSGWAVVILGGTLAVVVMLRRGRRLSRQLPPEDRRWMS
jgi:hypothetical protein